jgi:hypothetical protein
MQDSKDNTEGNHKECWGNPIRALHEIVEAQMKGDQGVPTCGFFP